MRWARGGWYGCAAAWAVLGGEAARLPDWHLAHAPWLELLFLYGGFGAVLGASAAPLGSYPRAAVGFAAFVATFLSAGGILLRETGQLPAAAYAGSVFLRVLPAAIALGLLAEEASRILDPAPRGARVAAGCLLPAVPITVYALLAPEWITGGGAFDLAAARGAFAPLAAAGVALGLARIFCGRAYAAEAAAAAALLFATGLTRIETGPDPRAAARGGAAHADAPNVVLVICDSLRADHTPWEGYARPTMPFLASLAESSTVYRRAVASSPVSALTIASIFSGKPPAAHGISLTRRVLKNPERTLPGRLRAAGYRTGALYWVPGSNFFGLPGVSFDVFHDASFPDNSGHDPRIRVWNLGALLGASGGKGKGGEDLDPLSYNRAWRAQVFDFLDGAGDRPFFLYAHDLRPHAPSHAVPDSGPIWGEMLTPESYRRFWEFAERFHHGPLDPIDRPVARARVDRYDDALRAHDDFLRDLFAGLRARKLDRKTVVLVTGDHGEPLGEEEVWTRSTRNVVRGVVWVPMVLFDPRDPVGREDTALVTSSDLAGILLARALGENAPVRRAVAVEGAVEHPYAVDGAYLRRTSPPHLGPWVAWPGHSLPPPRAVREKLERALGLDPGLQN